MAEGEEEQLSILEKLGTEEAEKFVHRAISDLCEKEGLRYEDLAKKLSLAEYSRLKRVLSTTLRMLAREDGTKEELSDKLSKMGVSPELSQLIAGCVWVRRGEVRSQMVRDSCAISHSHLNNFDWRLQLVMSSDKLGSIQQPVLSLGLDIMEGGQRRREDVELSREELAKLITSLEAANKAVMQLRT